MKTPKLYTPHKARHVRAIDDLMKFLTPLLRLTNEEQVNLEELLEEFVDARIERDRDKLENDRLWRD